MNITGFRIWRLKTVCGQERLYPVYIDRDSHWQRENVASCKSDYGPIHSKDELPDTDCRCGLHAYYDLKDALREAYYLKTGALFKFFLKLSTPKEAFDSDQLVIGLVSGHGRCQLHAHGFRSENMDVIAISSFSDNPEELKRTEAVSKDLGVPNLELSGLICLYEKLNKNNEALPAVPGSRRKEALNDFLYNLVISFIFAFVIAFFAVPIWFGVQEFVDWNTTLPMLLNVFLIPVAYMSSWIISGFLAACKAKRTIIQETYE